MAAVKALDALKEKVAPALGVEPARSSPRRPHSRQGRTLRRACRGRRVQADRPAADRGDGDWQPGLSSVTTSGVQFAEVTVDVETGIVKLTRSWRIQDCGLVVSRLTAESQVYGGVIGSLNFAMFEDRILDRNTGQMVNPNMEWYLLAGMSDIPRIDVRLKDQPERGVIGIGEPPTVPTAAAIALAVRNAIGVDAAQPAADAGEDPASAAAAETADRSAHESFRLRQPDEREGGRRRALAGVREGAADRRRPGSAGADEGLHHAARPRRQREEALESTVTPPAAASDRRGHEDGRSRRARRRPPDVSRHRRGGRSKSARRRSGTRRTVGGNLNQRPRCWYYRNEEFVCFKKGGNTCFSPAGENQFHAIFGGGPSFIVHPSSLAVPMVAYGATFRLARSERRAAGAGGGLLHDADAAERADGERAQAQRAADHVICPRPAA
jgi:hypothetical protein